MARLPMTGNGERPQTIKEAAYLRDRRINELNAARITAAVIQIGNGANIISNITGVSIHAVIERVAEALPYIQRLNALQDEINGVKREITETFTNHI